MSIKSQKSLNDECSEIIEKSYSVRSLSDESLSCSEEDETLARELLIRISPAVLSKLRRSFKRRLIRQNLVDIDRKVEEVMRVAAAEEGIEFAEPTAQPRDKTLWIDEDDFVSTLENIFGHHKYTSHAHQLFSLLDPFCTRKIWWSDLLERLVQVGGRRNRSKADCWSEIQEEKVELRQLEHCKRETIVKIVSIESAESFCYAAISRGGRVGLYSGGLELLVQYSVYYHRTGVKKRVKNCWITDALYMTDVRSLIISCSDRSLVVYDAATLSHTLVYCITGLPNIPTCMAYDASQNKTSTSELMFGDERGHVTRLRFLQPSISLLHKKYTDKTNSYFWMELSSSPHDVYCCISHWRGLHGRSVRRLHYCPKLDAVISCSHDPRASLVIRQRKGQLRDYVFKFPRGASCFHSVWSLRVVAAGCADGSVRVTSAGVSSAGVLLTSGRAPVVDVAVLTHMQIVIAYTKSCIIDIWDLFEECHLQTIKLKFPFLGVLGKKLEFGVQSLHPGPARELSEPSPPVDDGRDEYWKPEQLERDMSDGEYARWSRPELLVSAGDCVCIVPLAPLAPLTSQPLPPPRPLLAPRRPSLWDHATTIRETRDREVPEHATINDVTSSSPTSGFLPSLPEVKHDRIKIEDLDSLLEKAGLQGIFEKDFVKMMGLKHDINQKLAKMESHFEMMSVSVCAPYLALTLHDIQPVEPDIARLEAEWGRVLRLFPSSSSISSAGTPRSIRSRSSTASRRSK